MDLWCFPVHIFHFCFDFFIWISETKLFTDYKITALTFFHTVLHSYFTHSRDISYSWIRYMREFPESQLIAYTLYIYFSVVNYYKYRQDMGLTYTIGPTCVLFLNSFIYILSCILLFILSKLFNKYMIW